MNKFVASIFIVALLGAVQGSFGAYRLPFLGDKPDAPNAAAFLNAYFGLGSEKVNFNQCKGPWREAYLAERLEAAVNDFAAKMHGPNDLTPEAAGVNLLLHGLFELTYDFTGCEGIQKPVQTQLAPLQKLMDKDALQKQVDAHHKNLVGMEKQFTSDVQGKKYDATGNDVKSMTNELTA